MKKLKKLIIACDGESASCLLYTSPSPRTKANLVCRLLLEKKKKQQSTIRNTTEINKTLKESTKET